MYGVSDEYKTAMHQAVQKFRLTGMVGTASFTDENILAGSFSITNQCSGNNEIQIGQVYDSHYSDRMWLRRDDSSAPEARRVE